MSAFFASPTPLRLPEVWYSVFPDGRGALFLSGTSFVSCDTPLEARLLAVRFSELANAMEAQRKPEAVA